MKKGVVTPQKGVPELEDDDEDKEDESEGAAEGEETPRTPPHGRAFSS